ncbi:toxin [Cellulomonas sp. NPDC055163]
MPPTTLPRRVRVVGISGAGKTTTAHEAARRLGVPHLELDDVFWLPGWRLRELDDGSRELRERLAQAPDGWVACGNWTTRVGSLLDDVELVVWLDHPRWLVMAQVVRRTLVRAVTRRELCNGNRELWSGLVARDPEHNIVLWTWTHYARTREQYRALEAEGTVPVVRLSGRRAVRAWLDGLREPS